MVFIPKITQLGREPIQQSQISSESEPQTSVKSGLSAIPNQIEKGSMSNIEQLQVFQPQFQVSEPLAKQILGSEVSSLVGTLTQQGFNEKLSRSLQEVLHLAESPNDSGQPELLETMRRLGLSADEANSLTYLIQKGDAAGMAVAIAVASEIARVQTGETVGNDQHVDLHQLAQIAQNALPPGGLGAIFNLDPNYQAAFGGADQAAMDQAEQSIVDTVTQTPEYGNSWSADELNLLAQKYALPFGTDAVMDIVNPKLGVTS